MSVFNRQTVRRYACLIVLAACMPGSLLAAQTHEVSVEAVRNCCIPSFKSVGGTVW